MRWQFFKPCRNSLTQDVAEVDTTAIRKNRVICDFLRVLTGESVTFFKEFLRGSIKIDIFIQPFCAIGDVCEFFECIDKGMCPGLATSSFCAAVCQSNRSRQLESIGGID